MEYNSAGIIPLKKEHGEWKVFLIQNRTHPEYWSCPKGHLEPKEAPEDAACRELKEETNLQVLSFLAHPPIVETFTFMKNGKLIQKRVLFYIAEVEGSVILQKDEALDGKWYTFQEAIALTKHEEGKATLRVAERLVTRRSNPSI